MIKWMVKGHPTESVQASKGVPWLTDDQGASDGKSDGKASRSRCGGPSVSASGLHHRPSRDLLQPSVSPDRACLLVDGGLLAGWP